MKAFFSLLAPDFNAKTEKIAIQFFWFIDKAKWENRATLEFDLTAADESAGKSQLQTAVKAYIEAKIGGTLTSLVRL